MKTLEKNKLYLLACSYGPDSMALFHMLLKGGFRFIVVHVNYQMRGEHSDQEAKDLATYCKKKDIKLYQKSVMGQQITADFENWARNIRYNFFKEIASTYDEEVVILTGHHSDDVIETYIMQTNRQKYINYYGIRQHSEYQGVKIYRPLLNMNKDQILEYCNIYDVPYSIDHSNLEKEYTRNIIRIEHVNKLSNEEKAKILQDIENNNKKLEESKQTLRKKFRQFRYIDTNLINELSNDEIHLLAYEFFAANDLESYYTSGWAETIIDFVNSDKPNIIEEVGEKYVLIKEYEIIRLLRTNSLNQPSYAYVLEKPGRLETPQFALDLSLPPKRGEISDTSYPLVIRSPEEGDTYEIDGNIKQLNRIFIDWKMPLRLRKVWPVFVDKDGIIIFVPRYQGRHDKSEDTNIRIYLC